MVISFGAQIPSQTTTTFYVTRYVWVSMGHSWKSLHIRMGEIVPRAISSRAYSLRTRWQFGNFNSLHHGPANTYVLLYFLLFLLQPLSHFFKDLSLNNYSITHIVLFLLFYTP